MTAANDDAPTRAPDGLPKEVADLYQACALMTDEMVQELHDGAAGNTREQFAAVLRARGQI
ncbi:hypothetical protein [Sphingomonas sp. Y38-1Y]|uniref:hypothetical protein n=1 Tax=Sphingomonas sp. Y38-1Y TaxID=3078265 RepID=UPI0028E1E634|nr:hypothetical protein [Sphingomonas sp. Y38-1Y]